MAIIMKRKIVNSSAKAKFHIHARSDTYFTFTSLLGSTEARSKL